LTTQETSGISKPMNKLSVQQAIRELNRVIKQIDSEILSILAAKSVQEVFRMAYLKNLRAMVMDAITNLKREL
jgi:uncharacterized protein YnzC (UPF0291/DUF896 family)